MSVIIPAYNPSATLKEAIDSALAQTHPAIEVIVVDDGSTVDVGWVRQMYGDRIRYVPKANGGPASARNAGLAQARGEYVAFLDADDVWEADKVAAQVEALERQPAAGLAYSSVARIDAQGKFRDVRRYPMARSGRIAEELFMQNFVPTSTVMVRAKCFADADRFDETPELISVEDYDMWLRLAERWDAVYLDRPLSRYRMHAAGISRQTARSYAGEALVIQKAIRRNPASPFIAGARSLRFARLWFNCGHEHFTANRLPEARREFAKSLRYRPCQPRTWLFFAAAALGPSAVRRLRGAKGALFGPRRRPEDGRLRILHVLFTLQTGGAEHVALSLLERLDPRRYDRHVCSLTGDGELAEQFRRHGVEVHVLNKRPGVDPALAVALARLCRRLKPDIIHTHNATPWLYAALAAKWSGAALYHTEHSNLFPNQRRLIRAERWLARWTDLIISDSEKVRRQLIDVQRLPAHNIVTIVNGVDVQRFSRSVDVPAGRRALGLNGSGPVIGTVGRLAAVKDHATLLEAFRRVAEAVPSARLLIIGDGPLRQELEALARRLGLAEQARFLGRRADIPELMGLLDVFVLSSISEGLPLTVLEAMAAGVPVVSTDVGALREIIPDERFGRLVPAKSPDRLAEAILAVTRDAGVREMGRLARAEAQRFDLRHMVDGYEAAYHYEPLSERG